MHLPQCQRCGLPACKNDSLIQINDGGQLLGLARNTHQESRISAVQSRKHQWSGVSGAWLRGLVVVLHTDDGIRYGVCVPDLPGCFSAGDDLDDALSSVQEAIDLHVKTLIEDGVDIPARAPIATHQAKPDYASGVWAVVDVPVEKYLGPAEKINITVPRLLLSRIDSYASADGASRSGILVQVARAAMAAQV
jgi:predicted RNase H-like HicB family nuclease